MDVLHKIYWIGRHHLMMKRSSTSTCHDSRVRRIDLMWKKSIHSHQYSGRRVCQKRQEPRSVAQLEDT